MLQQSVTEWEPNLAQLETLRAQGWDTPDPSRPLDVGVYDPARPQDHVFSALLDRLPDQVRQAAQNRRRQQVPGDAAGVRELIRLAVVRGEVRNLRDGVRGRMNQALQTDQPSGELATVLAEELPGVIAELFGVEVTVLDRHGEYPARAGTGEQFVLMRTGRLTDGLVPLLRGRVPRSRAWLTSANGGESAAASTVTESASAPQLPPGSAGQAALSGPPAVPAAVGARWQPVNTDDVEPGIAGRVPALREGDDPAHAMAILGGAGFETDSALLFGSARQVDIDADGEVVADPGTLEPGDRSAGTLPQRGPDQRRRSDAEKRKRGDEPDDAASAPKRVRPGDETMDANDWAVQNALWVATLDRLAGNAGAPDPASMPDDFPTTRGAAWIEYVQARVGLGDAEQLLAELGGREGGSSRPSEPVRIAESRVAAARDRVTMATEWLRRWGITDIAAVVAESNRFQARFSSGLGGGSRNHVPSPTLDGPSDQQEFEHLPVPPPEAPTPVHWTDVTIGEVLARRSAVGLSFVHPEESRLGATETHAGLGVIEVALSPHGRSLRVRTGTGLRDLSPAEFAGIVAQAHTFAGDVQLLARDPVDAPDLAPDAPRTVAQVLVGRLRVPVHVLDFDGPRTLLPRLPDGEPRPARYRYDDGLRLVPAGASVHNGDGAVLASVTPQYADARRAMWQRVRPVPGVLDVDLQVGPDGRVLLAYPDGLLWPATAAAFGEWLRAGGRFTGQSIRLLVAAPSDGEARETFDRQLNRLARAAATAILWAESNSPLALDTRDELTATGPGTWSGGGEIDEETLLITATEGRIFPRRTGNARLEDGYVWLSGALPDRLFEWLQHRRTAGGTVAGVFDIVHDGNNYLDVSWLNSRLPGLGALRSSAIRVLAPNGGREFVENMQDLADMWQQDVVVAPQGAELHVVMINDGSAFPGLEIVPRNPISHDRMDWMVLRPRQAADSGVPATLVSVDGVLRSQLYPVRSHSAVYFPSDRGLYYDRALRTVASPDHPTVLTVYTTVSDGQFVVAADDTVRHVTGAELATQLRPTLADQDVRDIRVVGFASEADENPSVAVAEIVDLAAGLSRVVWWMDLGGEDQFVRAADGDIAATNGDGDLLNWQAMIPLEQNGSPVVRDGNPVVAASVQGPFGTLVSNISSELLARVALPPHVHAAAGMRWERVDTTAIVPGTDAGEGTGRVFVLREGEHPAHLMVILAGADSDLDAAVMRSVGGITRQQGLLQIISTGNSAEGLTLRRRDRTDAALDYATLWRLAVLAGGDGQDLQWTISDQPLDRMRPLLEVLAGHARVDVWVPDNDTRSIDVPDAPGTQAQPVGEGRATARGDFGEPARWLRIQGRAEDTLPGFLSVDGVLVSRADLVPGLVSAVLAGLDGLRQTGRDQVFSAQAEGYVRALSDAYPEDGAEALRQRLELDISDVGAGGAGRWWSRSGPDEAVREARRADWSVLLRDDRWAALLGSATERTGQAGLAGSGAANMVRPADPPVCAVCLEEIDGVDPQAASAPMTTPCDHTYHAECLLELVAATGPVCPLDREPFLPAQLRIGWPTPREVRGRLVARHDGGSLSLSAQQWAELDRLGLTPLDVPAGASSLPAAVYRTSPELVLTRLRATPGAMAEVDRALERGEPADGPVVTGLVTPAVRLALAGHFRAHVEDYLPSQADGENTAERTRRELADPGAFPDQADQASRLLPALLANTFGVRLRLIDGTAAVQELGDPADPPVNVVRIAPRAASEPGAFRAEYYLMTRPAQNPPVEAPTGMQWEWVDTTGVAPGTGTGEDTGRVFVLRQGEHPPHLMVILAGVDPAEDAGIMQEAGQTARRPGLLQLVATGGFEGEISLLREDGTEAFLDQAALTTSIMLAGGDGQDLQWSFGLEPPARMRPLLERLARHAGVDVWAPNDAATVIEPPVTSWAEAEPVGEAAQFRAMGRLGEPAGWLRLQGRPAGTPASFRSLRGWLVPNEGQRAPAGQAEEVTERPVARHAGGSLLLSAHQWAELDLLGLAPIDVRASGDCMLEAVYRAAPDRVLAGLRSTRVPMAVIDQAIQDGEPLDGPLVVPLAVQSIRWAMANHFLANSGDYVQFLDGGRDAVTQVVEVLSTLGQYAHQAFDLAPMLMANIFGIRLRVVDITAPVQEHGHAHHPQVNVVRVAPQGASGSGAPVAEHYLTTRPAAVSPAGATVRGRVVVGGTGTNFVLRRPSDRAGETSVSGTSSGAAVRPRSGFLNIATLLRNRQSSGSGRWSLRFWGPRTNETVPTPQNAESGTIAEQAASGWNFADIDQGASHSRDEVADFATRSGYSEAESDSERGTDHVSEPDSRIESDYTGESDSRIGSDDVGEAEPHIGSDVGGRADSETEPGFVEESRAEGRSDDGEDEPAADPGREASAQAVPRGFRWSRFWRQGRAPSEGAAAATGTSSASTSRRGIDWLNIATLRGNRHREPSSSGTLLARFRDRRTDGQNFMPRSVALRTMDADRTRLEPYRGPRVPAPVGRFTTWLDQRQPSSPATRVRQPGWQDRHDAGARTPKVWNLSEAQHERLFGRSSLAGQVSPDRMVFLHQIADAEARLPEGERAQVGVVRFGDDPAASMPEVWIEVRRYQVVDETGRHEPRPVIVVDEVFHVEPDSSLSPEDRAAVLEQAKTNHLDAADLIFNYGHLINDNGHTAQFLFRRRFTDNRAEASRTIPTFTGYGIDGAGASNFRYFVAQPPVVTAHEDFHSFTTDWYRDPTVRLNRTYLSSGVRLRGMLMDEPPDMFQFWGPAVDRWMRDVHDRPVGDATGLGDHELSIMSSLVSAHPAEWKTISVGEPSILPEPVDPISLNDLKIPVYMRPLTEALVSAGDPVHRLRQLDAVYHFLGGDLAEGPALASQIGEVLALFRLGEELLGVPGSLLQQHGLVRPLAMMIDLLQAEVPPGIGDGGGLVLAAGVLSRLDAGTGMDIGGQRLPTAAAVREAVRALLGMPGDIEIGPAEVDLAIRVLDAVNSAGEDLPYKFSPADLMADGRVLRWMEELQPDSETGLVDRFGDQTRRVLGAIDTLAREYQNAPPFKVMQFADLEGLLSDMYGPSSHQMASRGGALLSLLHAYDGPNPITRHALADWLARRFGLASAQGQEPTALRGMALLARQAGTGGAFHSDLVALAFRLLAGTDAAGDPLRAAALVALDQETFGHRDPGDLTSLIPLHYLERWARHHFQVEADRELTGPEVTAYLGHLATLDPGASQPAAPMAVDLPRVTAIITALTRPGADHRDVTPEAVAVWLRIAEHGDRDLATFGPRILGTSRAPAIALSVLYPIARALAPADSPVPDGFLVAAAVLDQWTTGYRSGAPLTVDTLNQFAGSHRMSLPQLVDRLLDAMGQPGPQNLFELRQQLVGDEYRLPGWWPDRGVLDSNDGDRVREVAQGIGDELRYRYLHALPQITVQTTGAGAVEAARALVGALVGEVADLGFDHTALAALVTTSTVGLSAFAVPAALGSSSTSFFVRRPEHVPSNRPLWLRTAPSAPVTVRQQPQPQPQNFLPDGLGAPRAHMPGEGSVLPPLAGLFGTPVVPLPPVDEVVPPAEKLPVEAPPKPVLELARSLELPVDTDVVRALRTLVTLAGGADQVVAYALDLRGRHRPLSFEEQLDDPRVIVRAVVDALKTHGHLVEARPVAEVALLLWPADSAAPGAQLDPPGGTEAGHDREPVRPGDNAVQPQDGDTAELLPEGLESVGALARSASWPFLLVGRKAREQARRLWAGLRQLPRNRDTAEVYATAIPGIGLRQLLDAEAGAVLQGVNAIVASSDKEQVLNRATGSQATEKAEDTAEQLPVLLRITTVSGFDAGGLLTDGRQSDTGLFGEHTVVIPPGRRLVVTRKTREPGVQIVHLNELTPVAPLSWPGRPATQLETRIAGVAVGEVSEDGQPVLAVHSADPLGAPMNGATTSLGETGTAMPGAAAPADPAFGAGTAETPQGITTGLGVPIDAGTYFPSGMDPDYRNAALWPAMPGVEYLFVHSDPVVRAAVVRGVAMAPRDLADTVKATLAAKNSTAGVLVLIECGGAQSSGGVPGLAEAIRDATGRDVVAHTGIIWQLPSTEAGLEGVVTTPFVPGPDHMPDLTPPTDGDRDRFEHRSPWVVYPGSGGAARPRDARLSETLQGMGIDAGGLFRMPGTETVAWVLRPGAEDFPRVNHKPARTARGPLGIRDTQATTDGSCRTGTG